MLLWTYSILRRGFWTCDMVKSHMDMEGGHDHSSRCSVMEAPQQLGSSRLYILILDAAI